MTALSKRLQALEARHNLTGGTGVIVCCKAMNEAILRIPAAPGDTRDAEQRLHAALFDDTPAERAVLAVLLDSVPRLEMTPDKWHELMDSV